MEHDTERLRLLTLDEAYELVQVLRTAAEEGGAAARDADRLAREIGVHPVEELTRCRPRPAQILTPCPAVVRPYAVTHFRARPAPGQAGELRGNPGAARAVRSLQPST
ncbi:DUF6417 family protein [Streptomyces sp. NBC_00723]|uniref:DUF6417 family protein n=1 Tax=Streptomyces sp. NBC_00723 TaxID=2903673 RepID=UPI003866C1A4